MARKSEIPPESFEEILAWLNPYRDVAGEMYLRLREELEQTFLWRKCADPEGMTDEVFDRVAKKVHEVRPTYQGDPRLYFLGVARNLIKENFKKVATHISLDDVNLSQRQTVENDMETERLDECFQSCLRELSAENHDLIVAYYAEQKKAKIDNRNALAERLGVSVETLRVKVHRIRRSIRKCIGRCLKDKAEQ
jgi:RNA polymerase sigma factor (sigma-70 family)